MGLVIKVGTRVEHRREVGDMIERGRVTRQQPPLVIRGVVSAVNGDQIKVSLDGGGFMELARKEWAMIL